VIARLERSAGALALIAAVGAALSGADRAGGALARRATAKACPVTLPNRRLPPPPARGALPPVPPIWDGNGKLWVKLWPLGVMVVSPLVVNPDGSYSFKIPWWRATRGSLSIVARRLDETAKPVRGAAPGGYGSTGFQPSAVNFSTQGCWRVTGRVGSASLSFVTLVVTPAGNGYGS